MMLLVLSVIHLFVQNTAALECFSCQAVNDANSCNNTLVCKDGQACFLNTSSINQHHMNVLGCIDNQQCAAHGNIPATIVGRDLNTRQTTDCIECCSSDHCNKNLCEHLKPQSCIDDESIDCARLNSLFNICNDISQAKKVCPKFCNLCNVVDGNWTPWSAWSSCDVTCKKGLKTRTRSCTNPAPQYGGQMCLGNSTDSKVCELDLCPNLSHCQPNPCVHGSCIDLRNDFLCTCDQGVDGRYCNISNSMSKSSPCVHGTCFENKDGFVCYCTAGFRGKCCNTSIDFCSSNPCIRGNCVNGVTNYTCNCPLGVTGNICETEKGTLKKMALIQVALLLISAVCGGHTLTCLQCDGVPQPRFCRRVVDCYDGELCGATRIVNEFGEEVYNLGCHTQKFCGNLTATSSKQCIECCGANLCNADACGEPGYPSNRGPVCFNCPSHTSTKPCHDIDFCLEEETCSIVGRQLFSSEVRTSKCISKHACRDPTGSHVSIIGKRDDAFAKRTQKHTCDLCCHDDLCNRNCLTASNIPDKDECTSNPCGSGGTCFDAINGYNCVCAPGFSGLNCKIDIDDCLIGLCGTYGTCIDGINNYICACETGYTGNNCEINIDECTSNPCGFGGTCFDAMNGYNCVCAPGYSGVNCEIDIDDCLIGLCGTHGTCNDKLNGYTCACAPGFAGKNCETKLTAAKDCTDVLHQSVNAPNGVYNVTTWKTHRTIQVYCDMTTAGGGWTVFQNRFDGSVNFTRHFSEYVNGFGDIHKEFWLGLENLHELVSQGNYELRIDVTAPNGFKGYETFPNFTISAGSDYTLHISPGHGSIGDNANDGMLYQNGMPFSTFDHDRDHAGYNCAQIYKAGWWYGSCMTVHLNGVYFSPGTTNNRAMSYFKFTKSAYSLKTSRMMFREV